MLKTDVKYKGNPLFFFNSGTISLSISVYTATHGAAAAAAESAAVVEYLRALRAFRFVSFHLCYSSFFLLLLIKSFYDCVWHRGLMLHEATAFLYMYEKFSYFHMLLAHSHVNVHITCIMKDSLSFPSCSAHFFLRLTCHLPPSEYYFLMQLLIFLLLYIFVHLFEY